MGKLIRAILVIAVIFIGAMGYLQWRAYGKKADLRKDGILYFKEEDYTKSIKYLEEAISIKTVFGAALDQDMMCYLAESYYKMEDYEKAEKLYHKLQRRDSDNALYYLLEGQSCASSGDYEKAMEIFQKGWEKTKDTAFISEICEIYIEQKEYDKALDYARKVIGKGGTASAELMYDMIIIYEKSQDYEAAYKAAKEYCEQYPEDEKGKRELNFLASRV
jgi:tetratricopeptide (TPR) repeat protein